MNTYQKLKTIKFFLVLAVIALGSTQFTGVPVMFYRPPKIEDQLDEFNKPMFDSEYPSVYSIPMEFDLYDDDEIYEVIILTLGYISKVFALAFLAFYPIKQKQAQVMFIGPVLAIGITLSCLVFYSSITTISIGFIIWYGCYSLIYGQVYQYAATQFDGKLAENSVLFINTSWSLFMLVHITFAKYFGGWRENLIYFTGFSFLGVGIALFIIQKYLEKYEQEQLQNNQCQQTHTNSNEQKNQQTNQMTKRKSSFNSNRLSIEINQNHHNQQYIQIHEYEQNSNEHKNEQQYHQQFKEQTSEDDKSSFQMLKEMFNEIKSNKIVRSNIILWGFAWSVCDISYIGCVLALNRLKGDLFFNLYISTLFEVTGNLISIYFIKNFDLKKMIINNLYIIGISYTSLLFLNPSSGNGDAGNENDSWLNILISVFPVLIAKGTHETMWNMLLEFQKQLFDVKYHQFSFSAANLYNILIDASLPYYQYSMEQIGFNQFVGYGIYSIVAAFTSKKFQVIKKYQQNDSDLQSDLFVKVKPSSEVELQNMSTKLLDINSPL